MEARVGAMRGREEMGMMGKGWRLNPRGWRRGEREWMGWVLSGSGLGGNGGATRAVTVHFYRRSGRP
jgi:hypothetical protein